MLNFVAIRKGINTAPGTSAVFCPLRNCGGEESRRNLFSSFPCPKGYKETGNELQLDRKLSKNVQKYPTVLQNVQQWSKNIL